MDQGSGPQQQQELQGTARGRPAGAGGQARCAVNVIFLKKSVFQKNKISSFLLLPNHFLPAAKPTGHRTVRVVLFSSGWDPADLDQIFLRGGIQGSLIRFLFGVGHIDHSASFYLKKSIRNVSLFFLSHLFYLNLVAAGL